MVAQRKGNTPDVFMSSIIGGIEARLIIAQARAVEVRSDSVQTRAVQEKEVETLDLLLHVAKNDLKDRPYHLIMLGDTPVVIWTGLIVPDYIQSVLFPFVPNNRYHLRGARTIQKFVHEALGLEETDGSVRTILDTLKYLYGHRPTVRVSSILMVTDTLEDDAETEDPIMIFISNVAVG